MKIVNNQPPYATIKLSIILNLLEERSSLHHFRMDWYQDIAGRNYYQEYFYLTLLTNLFSIDFEWKQDGFTLDTAGLAKNETQIASWL